MINEPIKISYVAVDNNENLTQANDVEIYVKYRVYYNLLKKGIKKDYEDYGDYYEEGLLYKKVNINGRGEFSFTPEEPGFYTVSVGKKEGFKSLITFYVEGPKTETVSKEDKENLSIVLNKEKYNIGENAFITVRSAIQGKLFLFVERERIYDVKIVDLINNKVTVSLPIKDEYMPNVYITGYVIRKPDEGLKNLPTTAFGIKNLELAAENKKIPISIITKENIQSSEGLNVKLKLSGVSKRCGVIITVVDEGILELTQFLTPDPFSFFYKKIALQGKTYSIFDLILPDLKPLKLAIGGDEASYSPMGRHINPIAATRFKSLALCSGILYPDENNEVNYRFDLPQFNGRLRITAIAADRDKFGAYSTYVNVSDPIVMIYALPRVLAPEDIVEVPVKVFNQTGRSGEVIVKLELTGPVKMEGSEIKKIKLANDAQGTVYFKVSSKKEVGKATFKFISSANGLTSTSTTELAIRPIQTVNTISFAGKLKPYEKVDINITNNFYTFSEKARVFVSSFQLSKMLSSLDYLISYPYGCTEQVISSAFPMIYYKKFANFIGYLNSQIKSIDLYIMEAIKRVEKAIINDNFSLWSGTMNFNEYLNLYGCHFLIEASRLGYPVSPEAINSVYKILKIKQDKTEGRRLNRMKVEEDKIDYENKSPYAIYLKTLVGSPDIETMNAIYDNSLKNLNYVDRCFLAIAFAVTGNKEKALRCLPDVFLVKYFPNSYGGDFDSVVKRLSICLEALAYTTPEDERINRIIEEFENYLINGRFYSTHDNARALMALYRVYEKTITEKSFDVKLYSKDSIIKSFVYNDAYILITNNITKSYRLVNEGKDDVYYNFYFEGIPLDDYVKPTNSILSVSRNYFDTNGEALFLEDVKIADIVVATIELNTGKEEIDNVVVVDIITAGFEIENPRLSSRGEIKTKYPNNWVGAYEDIRDDRLILFTGKVSGKVYYSYTLRAISEGIFKVPQIFAEAMYNPEGFSISKPTGKVTIRKRD